jgi:hypothetical protein
MDKSVVTSFWSWFAEQSALLSFLWSSGDKPQARSLVEEQLGKIGTGLRWEIGPGYRAKYRFSISHRRTDDPNLRQLGKEIMASSPDHMQGWEFCLVVLGAPIEAVHPAVPEAAAFAANAGLSTGVPSAAHALESKPS